MLITPTISSGISEIPVIDGKCLGPIVIPFTHHPSKTSVSNMYVRIIDEYEYIDPTTNKKTPIKIIEEFELKSIINPLVFKIQKSSENIVYKFDKNSDGTITKTEVTLSHEVENLTISLEHLTNHNLKFQLSYDGINWSSAVTTKCIPNIFNGTGTIDSKYFEIAHIPLGLSFIYYMESAFTKLKSLQVQTYYLEPLTYNEKHYLETHKIFNIKQIANTTEEGTIQKQVASCMLKQVADSSFKNGMSSNNSWWCCIFGTTIGGYNFAADIELTGWKKQNNTTLFLSADSYGIYIGGNPAVNTDVYATLCRRNTASKFWKPLTYHSLQQTYIDTQIINGTKYEYAYLENPNNQSPNTLEPAAASLISNDDCVAFNTTVTVTENANNTIPAPFIEDMYLQDLPTIENNGDLKTLYIAYNPQVSSFKRVIQEQKIETIGNQYPVFVRNGSINYHEFTIGGLISYLSDPAIYNNPQDKIPYRTQFYTYTEWDSKLTKDDTYTPIDHPYINSTNLTPENIETEIMFRTDVFNWLTNGENKTFYSPTEGTMIVRLSNVQLTPETKLGRMIYSFTAQVTEVDKIPPEEEGEIIT